MEMGRTTKILGFTVPPSMAKEVEQIAKVERRTKSELFREMFRVYKRYRVQRDQDDERWVMNLIREVEEEEQRRPMTPAELRKENAELARYGEAQSKKLGIREEDINRIIHEYRTQRRA
jgi:hypothetical protein